MDHLTQTCQPWTTWPGLPPPRPRTPCTMSDSMDRRTEKWKHLPSLLLCMWSVITLNVSFRQISEPLVIIQCWFVVRSTDSFVKLAHVMEQKMFRLETKPVMDRWCIITQFWWTVHVIHARRTHISRAGTLRVILTSACMYVYKRVVYYLHVVKRKCDTKFT